MKHILSIILFILTIASASFAGEISVAVVLSSEKEPYQQAYAGFKELLASRNIRAKLSQYSLEKETAKDIEGKIRQEDPSAIFAIGTKAAGLAKSSNKKHPVVFCMVLEAKAFSGPGISGITLDIDAAEKLKAIRTLMPAAQSIGAVYSDASEQAFEELAAAARASGFQVTGQKIRSPKDFPGAIDDISWRIDVFLMLADSAVYFPQSIKHLFKESLNKKFPVIGLSSAYTKAGAVISLEADYYDLGRQSAEMMIKVLNSERPGITRLRKTKLSLNLEAANRLGIRVPARLVDEAAEVFGR